MNIDGQTIVINSQIRSKNVIIIHGAGSSNRKRYLPMADEFLKHGIGYVIFDFSGHGESSGKLSESSLAKRKLQAKRVIDGMLDHQSALYLVGFSMGARTVCDLLGEYSHRIESIVLGCPALYDQSIYDMKFGDTRFTEGIRKIDSWKSSTGFESLQKYDGKTVIAIGTDDTVIPRGVIQQLRLSAKDSTYITYPGVDHQLANWLANNPNDMRNIVENAQAPRRLI